MVTSTILIISLAGLSNAAPVDPTATLENFLLPFFFFFFLHVFHFSSMNNVKCGNLLTLQTDSQLLTSRMLTFCYRKSLKFSSLYYYLLLLISLFCYLVVLCFPLISRKETYIWDGLLQRNVLLNLLFFVYLFIFVMIYLNNIPPSVTCIVGSYRCNCTTVVWKY